MLTNGTSTIWAIAAALTGPIFQGGRILENYRGTVAVWEETKLQYEQGVIKAFQDVASNLAALDQLAVAEAELARAVKALKKAVELAEIRYQYGLSSYFEVLDAEEKLFPAQNAQAEVRLNRLVAYVQLYKALGGGWNVKDPQSAAQPRAEATGAGR